MPASALPQYSGSRQQLAIVERFVAQLDHAHAGTNECGNERSQRPPPILAPSTKTHNRTPSSRSRLDRPISIAFSSVYSR